MHTIKLVYQIFSVDNQSSFFSVNSVLTVLLVSISMCLVSFAKFFHTATVEPKQNFLCFAEMKRALLGCVGVSFY